MLWSLSYGREGKNSKMCRIFWMNTNVLEKGKESEKKRKEMGKKERKREEKQCHVDFSQI